TLYHWRRAHAPSILTWLLPASNLQGNGPSPVGHFQGIGWTGTYDMAGNVREWCFNETGQERFILGGGWSDPQYAGQMRHLVQPPIDRSPINGFRLAIVDDEEPLASRARGPVPQPVPFDISSIDRISDEALELIRGMYDYDPTPLDAEIDATEETRGWIRERISFDAAYGDERMTLYLFSPTTGSPPYQTVLYWPGLQATVLDTIDQHPVPIDFVLKSGRAVAFPVYKGTFDRKGGEASGPRGSAAHRTREIQLINDLRRTLDYLETRADIDSAAFGYFGHSWGGAKASRALVLEPRLRLGVLYTAAVAEVALGLPVLPPEISHLHFLPIVEKPVLMLNGEFDAGVPVETAAKPYFEMLGTADADKRHVIAPGGHFVPRDVLIRETLDWLDKYLGSPGS
ncbi:MAG: SUMF1/EgtB/PvdO family nonheme iron enzyme, partial [Gammaproteobacteria bacterium]